MRSPLTFVTWKWRPFTGYRSKFGHEAVHALRRMVAQHYAEPHRFVCVTDDPAGLEGIETFPLWDDHASLPSPHGGHNPSCYRRLKLFSAEARDWFGERVVSMDLDTVLVGDLRPLFDRDEDFIIWGQSDFPKTQWYNGSLWYLVTGTRTQAWTEFDPKRSPKAATQAGKRGSDQGWLSYCLGPHEATWGTKDGVYSYRVHLRNGAEPLPANAKVVNFHGHIDPWHPQAMSIEWVRRNYSDLSLLPV